MTNLISFYQEYFDLQNATFTRIQHADAIIATVYQISEPSGTQSILKICAKPTHYYREMYFLKYFKNKLPVPNIIKNAAPTEKLNGAILMEYLPGKLLDRENSTNTLFYELGSLLANIHSNKAAGYGDMTQPDQLTASPRDISTQKFEDEFEECLDHLPKPLLKKCRDYYDTHIHLLNVVDGPCLVHRDFRPGNIIVDKEKICGVIDWSGAHAGFAEEDFYFLEGDEWLLRDIYKKIFLDGYASIRKPPNYHQVMPLLRISRALATLGFTIKSNTWNNSNASLYQRNRNFLEAFFDKLHPKQNI